MSIATSARPKISFSGAKPGCGTIGGQSNAIALLWELRSKERTDSYKHLAPYVQCRAKRQTTV
jgi:hypothetical protein